MRGPLAYRIRYHHTGVKKVVILDQLTTLKTPITSGYIAANDVLYAKYNKRILLRTSLIQSVTKQRH